MGVGRQAGHLLKLTMANEIDGPRSVLLFVSADDFLASARACAR